MTILTRLGRQAMALLLCLALVVWSVMPASTHTPAVLETIQDHLQMIADHGHSHGFEEDLYWAMHGHSHDVADHDHSQAFLNFDEGDGMKTWQVRLASQPRAEQSCAVCPGRCADFCVGRFGTEFVGVCEGCAVSRVEEC